MSWNRIAIGFVSCAAVCRLALAGEIYGRVTEGAGAVPEGTEVSVQCGDKSYPSAKTDKSGSYQLVTDKAGKCTVRVKRGAESAGVEIASYDDPVQCDLVVESKDGKLSVRRK